jgi:hypothetical protein
VTGIEEFRFGFPFTSRLFTLLWDLEREFGQNRFQGFWASEGTVDEAFRAAFQVPLAEWLVRWAQRGGETVPGNPVVPLNASLLSLMVLAGFAGLALWLGRRRG